MGIRRTTSTKIRQIVGVLALGAISTGPAMAAGHWYVSDDGTAKWQFGKWSQMKPADLAVGDFDGDGKEDLFLTWKGQWEITHGVGAGQDFGRWQVLRRSSTHRRDLRFGDVDGDGSTDVIESAGGEYRYYRGGRGAPVRLARSYASMSDIALGNFDDDAADELFMSYAGRWYSFGIGDGWRLLNRSTRRANSLAFGDFDGDGRTDVLSASGRNWFVSWRGTSGWTWRNRAGERVGELHVADFDGDGQDDLFRPNGTSWQVSYGAKSRYRQINRSREGRSQLLVGDFRGDGRADVLYPRRVKRIAKGISTHPNVAFSERDVNPLFRDAGRILHHRQGTSDNACAVEFGRSGALRDTRVAHWNITTQSRYDRAIDAPGGIYVASTLTWCGGTSPSAAGCAPLGGNDMVLQASVARQVGGTRRGGKLMAHEYGHNAGIRHSSGGSRMVMAPFLGWNAADNQELTPSHCNSIVNK